MTLGSLSLYSIHDFNSARLNFDEMNALLLTEELRQIGQVFGKTPHRQRLWSEGVYFKCVLFVFCVRHDYTLREGCFFPERL